MKHSDFQRCQLFFLCFFLELFTDIFLYLSFGIIHILCINQESVIILSVFVVDDSSLNGIERINGFLFLFDLIFRLLNSIGIFHQLYGIIIEDKDVILELLCRCD